jgi:EF-P beta-lysylation protein EpmB
MSHAETLQNSSWQKALADLITDPKELLKLLELDTNLLADIEAAGQLFPLRLPREYVSRIEKGNIHDPILKQILPIGKELKLSPFYTTDPLEEQKYNPMPGLLHKYHGRVLITLTGACAIHCRYCFRRHFPYAENQPGKNGLKKIIDYILEDSTINEVILSGGDPLAVNDALLEEFSGYLDSVGHVKRLRIHTRLPIILPSRITDRLLNWLNNLQQQAVIVFHINHPKEINREVREALLKLRAENATLLNQAVLLKDINNHINILKELSEQLFAAGVLPYYLHILDKVQGAEHFDIDQKLAIDLHRDLRMNLPGYLVPKLVREEAGQMCKTWVV